MTETGFFIVFEGLDGSGTSTQARLLHERLAGAGVPSVLTAQPTDGPVGRRVREALRHRVDFGLDEHGEEQQMGYLFAADRYHHLHTRPDGVLARLQAGEVVVCARYVWSSFAYNCRTDEDVARVARLNAGFPTPDFVFFVDVPVDVSMARIEQRGIAGEKYETDDKLTLVRRMYDRAMQEFPAPHHRLDGTRDPSALSDQVWNAVRGLLP